MKKKILSRISFTIEGSAIIEKENGWFVSTFLPLDITSQGRTLKEAEERLAEAVALYIESLLQKGSLEKVLIEKEYKRIKRIPILQQETRISCKKENILKEWDLSIPLPVNWGKVAGKSTNI